MSAFDPKGIAQFGGRAGMPDSSLFENVDTIGKRQREIDPLRGEQNRHALLLQRADIMEQRFYDELGQPLGRLI